MTNEQIMECVDLNTTEEVLNNGKKYFMNELRIKSFDEASTVIKK